MTSPSLSPSHARQLLKSMVERHTPVLAGAYRTLRDELHLQRQRVVATPYGFRLAGDRSMQEGRFEPVETELLRALLGVCDAFVDVGANVGFFSCLARGLGRPVVAVEPMPTNLRLLYANLAANGWEDVEVWPVALAARPGIAPMFGGGTGASLVPGWGGGSAAHRRSVSLSTLDQVLRGRFQGQQLLVKVDVEGAEFGLLQGARETLARRPAPAWLIEVTLDLHHPGGNRHFLPTFELAWEHGYGIWTAEAEPRPVTRPDVSAWVREGRCAFGTHNWLFLPPALEGVLGGAGAAARAQVQP